MATPNAFCDRGNLAQIRIVDRRYIIVRNAFRHAPGRHKFGFPGREGQLYSPLHSPYETYPQLARPGLVITGDIMHENRTASMLISKYKNGCSRRRRRRPGAQKCNCLEISGSAGHLVCSADTNLCRRSSGILEDLHNSVIWILKHKQQCQPQQKRKLQ